MSALELVAVVIVAAGLTGFVRLVWFAVDEGPPASRRLAAIGPWRVAAGLASALLVISWLWDGDADFCAFGLGAILGWVSLEVLDQRLGLREE